MSDTHPMPWGGWAVLPDVIGRQRHLQVIVPAALSSLPKIRSLIDIATTFMAPTRQGSGSGAQ